jgi:hypothetical protein
MESIIDLDIILSKESIKEEYLLDIIVDVPDIINEIAKLGLLTSNLFAKMLFVQPLILKYLHATI